MKSDVFINIKTRFVLIFFFWVFYFFNDYHNTLYANLYETLSNCTLKPVSWITLSLGEIRLKICSVIFEFIANRLQEIYLVVFINIDKNLTLFIFNTKHVISVVDILIHCSITEQNVIYFSCYVQVFLVRSCLLFL